jgi:hypothetical protein
MSLIKARRWRAADARCARSTPENGVRGAPYFLSRRAEVRRVPQISNPEKRYGPYPFPSDELWETGVRGLPPDLEFEHFVTAVT